MACCTNNVVNEWVVQASSSEHHMLMPRHDNIELSRLMLNSELREQKSE